MGPDAIVFIFRMLSFKPTFPLSSFTFIKRLFSSSSLSAIRLVSSANPRLLIFLLVVWIPACASFSPALLMMYSAYKLNKQGDNTKPQCPAFNIWSQSVVPGPGLTVASWSAYRFLQGRSGGLVYPSLSESSTIYCDPHQGFGIVNKAEIGVYLKLSCFFDDPLDVGNVISGSYAFPKAAWTSGSSRFMYCWSLAWRILSITSLACEMSAIVQ